MGLFFNNWLDEGFYEKDDYDTFTKLENPEDIADAKKRGVLYENDGIGTTHVNKHDDINI